ncbi:serine hydrolase [Spirulina sp. CCNP1310]|uniref:serine hydrolase n=1 Tax=Spirulina sp. CCNP1310 TaxID=3110249 RepID=UPI002B20FFD9|nr:serine hydrolase [Spirulina sp. CCNP1310]MEA5420699.1 serine hydrolase [Spirulina sp. CCNP1310]
MLFFQKDPTLEQQGHNLLEAVWAKFPGLARNQIALTWIVYDDPVIVNTGGAISAAEFWQYPVRGFSYRGVERIYPASVVKLFYLVAIHEWLETEMVQGSPELDRAIADMIRDSSNDATSLVLDVLSGTTSGPELPPQLFQTWAHQRNIVNRYYQALGWQELQGVNLNQKPWGDGPYGRERQFLGEALENRNMLTTDAIARLLHGIIGGVAVSRDRSKTMMQLLRRSLQPVELPPGEENQVMGFLGEGLPSQAKLWSKAGWTSRVRHDAAYIEVPYAQPYLLVVFTEGRLNSQNREILPTLSHLVLQKMADLTP